MSRHTSITIPEKIRKRLEAIAGDDEVLLAAQRDRWDNFLLRSHYRRIWEKLGRAERRSIRTLNPDKKEYDFLRAIADLAPRREGQGNPFRELWDEAEGFDGK